MTRCSVNKHSESIIKQMLEIDSKTFLAIKNFFEYGINSNYQAINSYPIILMPLILIIGMIRSMIHYAFYVQKMTFKDYNYKFIFVSTFDHTIRTKKVIEIGENLKHLVIYLPGMSIKNVQKHTSFYKMNKTANVYFPPFSLLIIVKFILFLIKNSKKLLRLSYTTSEIGDKEQKFLYKIVFQYFIYDCFTKNNLNNFLKNRDIKWLFDYDRTFLLPVINNVKNKGAINIHLQHGVLQNPNQFYIPNYCDYVMCCSEREKKHYIENGADEHKVFVIGAPFQSLSNDKVIIKETIKYDILVLLDSTRNEAYFKYQGDVIQMLNHTFSRFKILYRFRPASRNLDQEKFKHYISVQDISIGNSLLDDVINSRTVISFSFDAIFDVIRQEKPFLIVSSKNILDESLKTICITEIDLLKERVIDLLENKNNYFDKKTCNYNFGELDYDLVKKRFVDILNSDIN